MKLAVVAFTRKGAGLCRKLCEALSQDECTGFAPEKYADRLMPMGSLDEWMGKAFSVYDGIVFISACGIAVRAITPFLKGKTNDPAVVVLDEGAQFAISLLSGHIGGANSLTRRVAEAARAQPVLTTATDARGVFAADSWAVQNNMSIFNPKEIKAVSSALLNGDIIGLSSDFKIKGSLPEGLLENIPSDCGISISLTEKQPYPKTLHLVPKILHLGIGCRKGTDAEQIEAAVFTVLREKGISPSAIAGVSSIDLKESEGGLIAFCRKYGLPFRVFSAKELGDAAGGFSESEFVKSKTGVGNVCERAACLAAGAERLLIPKTIAGKVTVAAAMEEWNVCFDQTGGKNEKKIYVVGIGPGGSAQMTPQAAEALQTSDVIAGYEGYIQLVRERFAGKRFISTGMTKEKDRCVAALREAAAGNIVSLVCSGDAGIYGMAGLVLELAEGMSDTQVEIVPGITAACSGGALLGAPLGHDFAVVSLSDLLTPWETIEKRLDAAARADLALCLYNPSSHKRSSYLKKACEIVLRHQAPDTICGIAKNTGRDGETVSVMTLAELKDMAVDMFTTVFIGNSKTKKIGKRMVTPRGYRDV